jgi:hypothetical protein
MGEAGGGGGMAFGGHSGALVITSEPQMCNCTSGNLEIPGSRFAHPGMTADRPPRMAVHPKFTLAEHGEPR